MSGVGYDYGMDVIIEKRESILLYMAAVGYDYWMDVIIVER